MGYVCVVRPNDVTPRAVLLAAVSSGPEVRSRPRDAELIEINSIRMIPEHNWQGIVTHFQVIS
jgi:hypothetical protein